MRRRTIERLGRSLKYECVFFNAFETQRGTVWIGRRIDCYNTDRPHTALAGRTPTRSIIRGAPSQQTVPETGITLPAKTFKSSTVIQQLRRFESDEDGTTTKHHRH